MPETSREECPFDQLLKRKKKSKINFFSKNFDKKRAQVEEADVQGNMGSNPVIVELIKQLSIIWTKASMLT